MLGPVRGWRNDTELDLGPPQQRALFAVLLAHAGRPVSLSEMVDALWADAPPASAVNIVQRYIGRLRRVMQPDRPEGSRGRLLVRAGRGYRLATDAASLDLLCFRELVAQAEGEKQPELKLALFVEALHLWQGPAAAGIAAEVRSRPLFAALDREVLRTVRHATDVALAVHVPEPMEPLLRRAADAHPLDESVLARLMLVLAASGRQAEALSAFQSVRIRLAEELGVEPGPELAAAHTSVLRGHDGAAPAEPLRRWSGRDRPAPAQLPADLPTFTGRRAAIAELLGVLTAAESTAFPSLVIHVISGMAGIGKTTLAVHLAHQLAVRFPDGQLYANLRGFGPIGSTVAPGDALRNFLDALGVPAARVPADLHEAAALYRSHLAGRRMLILLDNARNAEQVIPLLPGTPGSLVLVTSRNDLGELVATQGAHPLTLDLLSAEDARDMLARRVGADRVAAEPEAVDEIVARSARLPLALATVAAQAAVNRAFPLSAIANELRRARGSLEAFAGPAAATDARAAFSWSYHALSDDAARLFRLLALHPGGGTDVGVGAIAALAGRPVGGVQVALAGLHRANLVLQPAPGRYVLHDLLHAYAAELAEVTESEEDRRAALHRLLDYYLQTCHTAYRLLAPPRRYELTLPTPLSGVPETPLDSAAAAVAWLAGERPALLAAVEAARRAGFDAHALPLALSVGEFLDRQGRWQEWFDTQSAALAAAERLGDRAAQALSHRLVGIAASRLDRHDEAHAHLNRAIEVYAELGDQVSKATTLRNLSYELNRCGRHEESRALKRQALELYRSVGDRVGEANCLNEIGWTCLLLGDAAGGLARAEEALDLLNVSGDARSEAATRDTIGLALHRLGLHQESIVAYQEAIRLRRETGDRYPEAVSLNRLGDVQHASGDLLAARHAWRSALEILTDLEHPDAEAVGAKLS
ncbi:AfsR/SARP family transcriptional regulator [Micromonospora echinaurantiaca]|uniref:AfsR/SARP family transcriptional regulator n=1 Tax=Micromonospora echinaurantiaca TaxID=47857 RepID=UPI001E3F6CE7|nr:BTAD domain-containing putative transcriptional regulator [Micromonospora echinaurantiaca]